MQGVPGGSGAGGVNRLGSSVGAGAFGNFIVNI